jgi:hypothetical protein
MHCWWWEFWTFVTLNVTISLFYLYLHLNYERSKWVYVFGTLCISWHVAFEVSSYLVQAWLWDT